MQKENEQVLLYVSKNNELAIKVPQNPVLAKQIQQYLQEKCELNAEIHEDNQNTVYVRADTTNKFCDDAQCFSVYNHSIKYAKEEHSEAFKALFPSINTKEGTDRVFPGTEIYLLQIPELAKLKQGESIKCNINMNVLETKSSLNFNNINQEKKPNLIKTKPTKNENLEKKQSKVESCGGCITM